MRRVQQTFSRPLIKDIPAEIAEQLSTLDLKYKVKSGESVAVTVGSRGIANIAVITKAVVAQLRSLGAEPFIVPAMGSHGGATAAGQQKLIEDFGVTAEFVGAPIRSSMDTVIVDTTPEGIPVHFDKHAYEADHVIIMGRIKPHTGFVGPVESGLHKMMLIGLGKHAGALMYHRAIKNFSFETIIRSVANVVIEQCRVLAGVAIVENAYDETALIEAVAPSAFFEREQQLLQQAISWMPRLPFDKADLLIVDRIGKNISGTGMDTNVVGRKYNDHEATDQDTMNCKRIFVRGLTAETKGNATGIGLAEFTTQRAVDQIDMEATRINCITSSHPGGGMLPFAYQNDRDAINDALQTIGLIEPQAARIMHIRDTLHLAELFVSEAYLHDAILTDAAFTTDPTPLEFDEHGNLPNRWFV